MLLCVLFPYPNPGIVLYTFAYMNALIFWGYFCPKALNH